MKVKCTKLHTEMKIINIDSDSWLTLGKEYIVLNISISSTQGTLYRLIGDNEDKMPALYKASQFEIVSGKIPSNWEIFQRERSDELEMIPRPWKSLGFWVKCYDLDPNALEIYKREVEIIYSEENSL